MTSRVVLVQFLRASSESTSILFAVEFWDSQASSSLRIYARDVQFDRKKIEMPKMKRKVVLSLSLQIRLALNWMGC